MTWQIAKLSPASQKKQQNQDNIISRHTARLSSTANILNTIIKNKCLSDCYICLLQGPESTGHKTATWRATLHKMPHHSRRQGSDLKMQLQRDQTTCVTYYLGLSYTARIRNGRNFNKHFNFISFKTIFYDIKSHYNYQQRYIWLKLQGNGKWRLSKELGKVTSAMNRQCPDISDPVLIKTASEQFSYTKEKKKKKENNARREVSL